MSVQLSAARARAAIEPLKGLRRPAELAMADKWEEKARTKQLPSTRTEIGAGGELIDTQNRLDALGVVNTIANPDYVTAAASRYRLDLANQASSLDLALDAANSIRAQDSLEKMLVHQMAVIHRGVMKASSRMNEELDRAAVLGEGTREAATCGLVGLPLQSRACQPPISKACLRSSASELAETSRSR